MRHITLSPHLQDEWLDIMEVDTTAEPYQLIDVEQISQAKRDRVTSRMHKILRPKELQIVLAFLFGLRYNEIGVTEKYWRYHINQAIKRLEAV